MYVGLLTARFPAEKSLESIITWASQHGFKGLEVAAHHLQIDKVLKEGPDRILALLKKHSMQFSSIAYYRPVFHNNLTPEEYMQGMRQVIRAADLLGVPVICTLAGFPAPGKNKEKTIREDLPSIFLPLAEEAGEKGIKIAFENWYATNLQGLHHFQALVESVPVDNVGFNFDPSHLYWQQIDYIQAVYQFGKRIFHTHAKDCLIRSDLLRRVGVLEGGWWRYVIPGYGGIRWAEYIEALRDIQYQGVLSIEHEDHTFDAESGFICGARYLNSLL